MLKIFGANYFGFRIYNLIIIVFLYINMYILFQKLNTSKMHSAVYTIIVFIFLKNIILYGANYNVLAQALMIIGIMLNIEMYINKKNIKYYNCLQGLIIFLIIFTKQNIGIYYFISNLLVEIFVNKNKAVKNIIKQSCIMLLLSIAYLIYLMSTKSLNNFIDYTILGMPEFANQNKFIGTNYLGIWCILIFYNIFCWLRIEKEREKIIILTIYSMISLLIALPICEEFHTLIAGIPLIITFMYCLHISVIKNVNIPIKTIICILVLFITIGSIYLINCWRISYINNKDIVYYGAVTYKKEKDIIETVTNYIIESEQNAIIVSPDASIYNMLLGIDNGILDLPTQGNVGKNGAVKVINEIKKLRETKILVMEPKMYWQEYDEVRDYIKNNLELIDEIECNEFKYVVYYKK